MLLLQHNHKRSKGSITNLNAIFRSENGAIDLASIMVGIIVIGMIGGTIAATVFAVIPWSQDNAAKQQLDSIVAAESAYMGLSSTNPPSLPAGLAGNSYGSSAELETAGLLKTGAKYCVSTTTSAGKSYEAFAKSSSGNVWSATDKVTKPVLYTGTLPTDCQFIGAGTTSTPAAPYVDPTPTKTILTYNCDATTVGTLPLRTNLTGTETWNDGSASRSYTNATGATAKSLAAGVTYQVTFDGTYKDFDLATDANSAKWKTCLRSVDHWGLQTGVTSARNAFSGANRLTDVPDNIPTTITTMQNMFQSAAAFNDPSVSKWDTSNVTNMAYTFGLATSFNQPLNDWNVSNVTDMMQMFVSASSFNQPLDKWNTSKVTTMNRMFTSANAFNQPLNSWKTGNVQDMNWMFRYSAEFNQPLNNWDVSKVTNMSYMFANSVKMNNDLSMWNTASLTDGSYFRYLSAMPSSYKPPGTT